MAFNLAVCTIRQFQLLYAAPRHCRFALQALSRSCVFELPDCHQLAVDLPQIASSRAPAVIGAGVMLRTTRRLVAVPALCGVVLYVLLGYYLAKTTASHRAEVRVRESQWLLIRLWRRLSSYAPASDAHVRPEAEGPSTDDSANDPRESFSKSRAGGSLVVWNSHALDIAALKVRLTSFLSKAVRRNRTSDSQLPPYATLNTMWSTTHPGGSSSSPTAKVLTPLSAALSAAAASYSRGVPASSAPAVGVATGAHPVDLDLMDSSNFDLAVPDVQSSLSEVLNFGCAGASLPTKLASVGAGADSLRPAEGSSADVSPQIFDYSDSETRKPPTSGTSTVVEWQSDKVVVHSPKQSDAGLASVPPTAALTASGSTQEFSGGIASSRNLTTTSPATDSLDQNVTYVTGFVGIGRLGNNMLVYANVFDAASQLYRGLLFERLAVAGLIKQWKKVIETWRHHSTENAVAQRSQPAFVIRIMAAG